MHAELLLKRNCQKCLFFLLFVLSAFILYGLNERLQNDVWEVIQEILFLPELPKRQQSEEGNTLLKKTFYEKEKEHHTHEGHDHDLEVGFILHESELGEPEFIGHNDNQGDYFNSFLRVDFDESNVEPVFVGSVYPERNIALGCALTTRHEQNLNEENLQFKMPFFRSLLTSFCQTATRGFHYNFYVSHDHSDDFFSTKNAHNIFSKAFYKLINTQCSRTVNVTLHLVECHHSGRPAWAQNDAMMAAYMDEMDYYYRLNDDTVLETTGWTEKFIDELQRFNPPNIGVVGPWFKEGNTNILTHDFVHRTHIDIFGFYYPRVFTDWFADDWITQVYWPERSKKVPGTRVKHTMEKGMRYMVHYEKAKNIEIECSIGKIIIQRYIDRTINGKVEKFWNEDSVGVVSMSLFGNDVSSVYGILRYAQLLPIVFPEWRLRVYTSLTEKSLKVLKIVARKLENFGVEVINLNNSNASKLPPELWKYLIIDDLKVKRFIVRDSDTRPSEREFMALEDWTASNISVPFYCIRDHYSHVNQALPLGLFGGIPKMIKTLLGAPSETFLLNIAKNGLKYMHETLWKKFQMSVFCHDSVSCNDWSGSHPFPALRMGDAYVGRKFDSNDQLMFNENDVDWVDKVSQDPYKPCVILKNTGFSEEAVRSVVSLRPVLWSQDYHITPMMDLKSLLGPIGVKIIDNSLSYHCMMTGTCAKHLKVINSDNGMSLTKALIKKFYQAYKDDSLMNSVSSFVCTLPVSMCELYKPFNKSMIIWASIRYEQSRNEPAKWRSLNRLLGRVDRDKSSVLAANSLYDAKYIEYFTGLKPTLIPNYCAYLTDSYRPIRKQFLVTPIHSTELHDIFYAEFDNSIMKVNADLSIVPLRDMYPQYLYKDLASHKGIIYIPYQVSMISLTEQYRMNIPMFFPSLDLLTSWHLKFQVVRQRTWSGYMLERSNSSNIKGIFSNVPDPNDDFDEDAIRYWLQFADFYQWPHLIYFDSIDDLVNKMLNVDLNEISKRMKVYNNKVKAYIKKAWSDVLINITNVKLNQLKENKIKLDSSTNKKSVTPYHNSDADIDNQATVVPYPTSGSQPIDFTERKRFTPPKNKLKLPSKRNKPTENVIGSEFVETTSDDTTVSHGDEQILERNYQANES
ncbi:hypothetical protein HELRODRAFT_170916 [Helobdella robusta]|uniref:Uncharacterized protein n=1 Tax=Helobdella robusta TaxID=6412 RepID=T1F3L5_HELRO|nr:hypothetical protein HELRODRAFT_170916 [Helobdella robusta]ESO06885.1 hypothetical protein HELRODRAFT_170916 [Helobdella robusta]